MATIESYKIYLGTPAEFAVATQAFSSRSQRAYRDAYGGWPEAFYWYDGHGLWPDPSANPVIVRMQPLDTVNALDCEIATADPYHPGTFKHNLDTVNLDFRDCEITAYKIAERKTRLQWLCSEASYPALEKRWHDLIAELRRLGSIESEEPAEPERRVPEPPPKRGDPEYLTKRRQYVKEHWLKADPQEAIAREQGVNRSTVQRDLDWLEECGEIPPRKKRKQVQL